MIATLRCATAEDAPAIARVRIDCWRTAYRGIVPDAYLDGMDIAESTDMWSRVLTAGPNTASVFVADDGGDVVGFAAGNMLKEPRFELDAELSAVYVRRDHQRAGIGRRLVESVARAQRAHGATGMIVWVIAGNKAARAFCESLGATLRVEQDFEWDGMPLVEAGYGLSDLDALIRAGEADDGPQGPTAH